MYKYLVVAGSPLRSYTGTTTFTGLKLVMASNNFKEAKQFVKDNYDEHAGLIGVFNSESGKEVF